jgi:hypothetical protein
MPVEEYASGVNRRRVAFEDWGESLKTLRHWMLRVERLMFYL